MGRKKLYQHNLYKRPKRPKTLHEDDYKTSVVQMDIDFLLKWLGVRLVALKFDVYYWMARHADNLPLVCSQSYELRMRMSDFI